MTFDLNEVVLRVRLVRLARLLLIDLLMCLYVPLFFCFLASGRGELLPFIAVAALLSAFWNKFCSEISSLHLNSAKNYTKRKKRVMVLPELCKINQKFQTDINVLGNISCKWGEKSGREAMQSVWRRPRQNWPHSAVATRCQWSAQILSATTTGPSPAVSLLWNFPGNCEGETKFLR